MNTRSKPDSTLSAVQAARRGPRRGRPGGYVLVMTLVLIAIAGIVLAGLARQSLQLANEAVDAQTELQRRWGSVCIEQVILSNSKSLLKQQEETDEERVLDWGESPRYDRLQGEIVLGDLTFVFQITDEDAKINLNTLYRELPQHQELVDVLNRLTDESTPILLRPALTSGKSSRQPVFHSWGQVFEYERFRDPAQVAPQIASASRNVTCWGSGKLNYRTTSQESLALVADLALSKKDTQRLLERREEWLKNHQEKPYESISVATGSLGLRASQRRKLLRLVSDRTTTYSMWLTISCSQRSWSEFHVAQPAAGQEETVRFQW